MDKAYEVDASSMCEALSGVAGVEDVSLEFDLRGNGVLRITLLGDADEDTVVGVAVARLRRRYGVGLEGGRLRLTGPSGRPVVAVVQGPRRSGSDRAPAGLDASGTTGTSDGPGAADTSDGPGAPVGAETLTTPAAVILDPPASPPSPDTGARDTSTWYPGLAEPQHPGPLPELPRSHRTGLPRSGSSRSGSPIGVDDPTDVEGADDPRSPTVPGGPDRRAAAQTGRPDPVASPQVASAQGRHREQRLVLERVDVASGRIEMWATVHLRCGNEVHTGTAGATATGSGMHRAVVSATARAAESALGGRVRLDVEAVDLLSVGSDQVGVVVMTLLTGAGVDRLSGAALVRSDGPSALVRATLDAVNRRTERLDLEHPAPRS